MLAESDVVEKFKGFAAIDADGCLLCQVQLKTKGGLPILEDAVVIPVHCFAERRTEIDDLAFIRTPEITAESVVLADVNAIDETQFAAEIGREIVVVGGKIKMTAAVGCVQPKRIALLRSDDRIAGGK